MDGAFDRIYESALVPELWPATLRELGDATGSAVGLIVRTNKAGMTVVSTPGSETLIDEYQRLDLFNRSQRMPRLFGQPYSGFLQDADIYSEDEQRQDPAYAEFLWPLGLGYGTATAMRFPSEETVIVDFERRRADGPFSPSHLSWLDRIRPHLARACTISFQLDLERARSRVSSLQSVGRPAAVLDDGGRVIAANELFQALMPRTFLDSRTRLRIAHPASDRLLEEAILARADERSPRSIAIPRQIDSDPMVAHVLPIRRAGRDIFTRASHLVAVTVVRPKESPNADLVEMLFDLTPAEARVARAIGGGATVDQASTALKVSPLTIRSQLKAVFLKTGIRRQSELVALLDSASL